MEVTKARFGPKPICKAGPKMGSEGSGLFKVGKKMDLQLWDDRLVEREDYHRYKRRKWSA
jgi:hypothetical protein